MKNILIEQTEQFDLDAGHFYPGPSYPREWSEKLSAGDAGERRRMKVEVSQFTAMIVLFKNSAYFLIAPENSPYAA